MVVICLPAASLTGTAQERIATPSICTVQAPHCAMPQPYLVPVRPMFAHHPQQRRVRLDVDIDRLSVDAKLCHWGPQAVALPEDPITLMQ